MLLFFTGGPPLPQIDNIAFLPDPEAVVGNQPGGERLAGGIGDEYFFRNPVQFL